MYAGRHACEQHHEQLLQLDETTDLLTKLLPVSMATVGTAIVLWSLLRSHEAVMQLLQPLKLYMYAAH
jgi:hypothetical protein